MASKVILGKPAVGATSLGWHSTESIFRCDKEYQYQHVRKIRQPQSGVPEHFAVGILFHAGRAHWFANNFKTSAKAVAGFHDAMVAEAERQKLPVSQKAILLAFQLFDAYCTHWMTRPLPKPVAAEYELEAQLLPGNEWSRRTTRLDDVSVYPEAGNALALGELKTTSGEINDVVNQYELHGQPALQRILWDLARGGKEKFGPVSGFVLDIVKKGYGGTKPKFARQYVPVSESVLAWARASIVTQVARSQDMEWDDDVVRNIGACTRMVGRQRIACPYRDLCVHGKSASIKYVLENGESLLSYKGEVKPWT